MRKFAKTLLVLCAALLLAAGVNRVIMPASAGELPSFRVELVIDAQGVYSVFYTAYLDGGRVCSGAQADLDGRELEEGRVLEYDFYPYLLGDDADLSAFSIDFSTFDDQGSEELGRTNAVEFPAKYGNVYRIHLTKDESGFHAVPVWDAEDERERFTIEITGNVNPREVTWSYIQADYFLGSEQYGFLYTCADEDGGLISLEFYKEDLEMFSDEADFSPDLSDFRLDLWLSYSEFKGDEAVLQAMYGNTGENVFLTSIEISAEYGQTYKFNLSGGEGGYILEAAND